MKGLTLQVSNSLFAHFQPFYFKKGVGLMMFDELNNPMVLIQNQRKKLLFDG